MVVAIISILLIEFILISPNFSSLPSKDVQISETPKMQDNKISSTNANNLLSNAPRAFTENRGQLENDEVRFYAQGGGLWFTDDGVWFELREEISIVRQESRVKSQVLGLRIKD